jgi:hypothetical protein
MRWQAQAIADNAADTEVFVYTGRQGGNNVPQDVVRVRVDPSITSIPAKAFYQRKKLIEAELCCEGVVEIGYCSFMLCGNYITKIIIPNSLRRINNCALDDNLN